MTTNLASFSPTHSNTRFAVRLGIRVTCRRHRQVTGGSPSLFFARFSGDLGISSGVGRIGFHDPSFHEVNFWKFLYTLLSLWQWYWILYVCSICIVYVYIYICIFADSIDLFIWTCWYVLYCTVLYCIVLYCIVLYCTVLHGTVRYSIVLYCLVLYCSVLCCFGWFVLYCMVSYCLDCIVLFCFALHGFWYHIKLKWIISSYFTFCSKWYIFYYIYYIYQYNGTCIMPNHTTVFSFNIMLYSSY